MRIFCVFLAIATVFCFPVGVSAEVSDTENVAYLSYKYDAGEEILTVSLTYFGEKLSAIGATVAYDARALDYTSYTRGDGFCGFSVLATLDGGGRINIIAHSADGVGVGELIRLCFKVNDAGESGEYRFDLAPLSTKPAAVIRDDGVRSVELGFFGVLCKTAQPVPSMTYAGVSDSGEILLAACDKSAGECFFDITVVELSGKIRRVGVSLLPESLGDESVYSLSVGVLGDGYTSVIVEPYYVENDKRVCVERGIYLFRNGEYMG